MSLMPLMNNTKWEELRAAMLAQDPRYQWRSKPVGKDFIYGPDGEWFYHFNVGGYEKIEWVEILSENEERQQNLIQVLQKIHLPGEIRRESVLVIGYQMPGQSVQWV